MRCATAVPKHIAEVVVSPRAHGRAVDGEANAGNIRHEGQGSQSERREAKDAPGAFCAALAMSVSARFSRYPLVRQRDCVDQSRTGGGS